MYTNISHDLGIKALRYWTDKCRDLIPERFTQAFIIEAAEFVLRNNYFIFDNEMFLQVIGTATGTIFAPPYACLSMGYLEVVKLYPQLRQHFETTISDYIIELYKRYMDDGIVALPKSVDIKLFQDIFQSLDDNIKFTFEEAQLERLCNGEMGKTLSFLDVALILHRDGSVETDVFYKTTNSHDYLSFDSHHPKHTRENVPYNLAKRIVVFCSNHEREKYRLSELKQWLIECGYPEAVIDRKFHNAKLQGPAPEPKNPGNVIPFVSTFYSNYKCNNITHAANTLLKSCHSEHMREVFGDCNVILSLRQPPNLLRKLTRAEFISTPQHVIDKEPGLFKCNGKKCNLCKLDYIQECKLFPTSNGVIWNIKSHITCNSSNVLYYLKCSSCNQTYTGKTNNLRLRMNNHKSGCKLGNNSDIFDKHVFQCRQEANLNTEPLFLIFAFMTVKDERLLLPYESYLHSKKLDTMN